MSSNPEPTEIIDDGSRRGRVRGLRHLPLRTKLIAIFILVILAVALAIGGITQVLLTRHLTAQLDHQLAATSMRLTGPSAVGPTGGPPAADGPGYPKPDDRDLLCVTGPDGPGTRQPDNSIFAIDDGVTIAAAVRGAYPTCQVLTTAESAALAGLPTDGSVSTVALPDIGDFRVIAHRAGDITFISGLSTASIDSTRSQLTLILVVVTAVAVLIGGGAVWWSVRRSLAPLEQVAATARKATALPLHRGEVELAVRVPAQLTDPRTEAGAVGSALNQLLSHVEISLAAREQTEARLRQFVADASHELRTPLTAIRGYAELAGRHPDDTPGVRRALSRVESESARMSELVEDLLLLARLDEGRPLQVEPVDLTELAVEMVADMRVAAPDHHWSVTVPTQPVLAKADPARLHQILANLLTNARVHTPAGSTVTVDVTRSEAVINSDGEPRDAVVMVTDDGPGIPADLDVFGRFVRADSSRARASGSTGLGLAIVAGLVAALHGTVSVASAPGRTAFTVRLPAAD